MIRQNKEVVFISGHDHTQQYFINDDGHHFLVSGAGSKSDFARKGGRANFASAQTGFTKLYFYQDGAVYLEFISATLKNPAAKIQYRKMIVAPSTVDIHH